jgi:hypothetical protein
LEGILRVIRGIRERSYIEFKKLHKSCIEHERIKVTERLEAIIEVAIDLKAKPTLSKKFIIFSVANYTGISTSS